MNLGELLSIPRYTESYTNLAKERILFISEDITQDTASSLSAMLLYYDSQNDNEDISLYINTNGGDAIALLHIYDVMQMIKSPIKTVCIGKAYSAGSVILAAGTKGKRFITKNSSVMIHGLQCAFPGANSASQIDSKLYLEFLKDFNSRVIGLLAKHTEKEVKQVLKDCDRDCFLDAKDALNYNLVDAII